MIGAPMLTARLRTWLAHPLTRGVDLDDPSATVLRRQIIQQKSGLRQIYREWYEGISSAMPAGEEPVLEVGSGPGFLGDYIPKLIRSEVFPCRGVELVLDAAQLPFAAGTLRGIVMTDVLHHVPQPRTFLTEAGRCVRPGGVLAMVEPWVTPWSKLVYGRLHHEPFRPEATQWEFRSAGPLSGANGALPWIIFQRDRERFEREFPEWWIRSIVPMLPFRYLVSGGVSMRTLMPAAGLRLVRRLEQALQPWMRTWAMFARIVLVRLHNGADRPRS